METINNNEIIPSFLDTLKSADFIKEDFLDVKALDKILDPIPSYADNEIFEDNINDILGIIAKDKNTNNKFLADDILLFTNDINAMTAFINSILLILNSLPAVKVKYTQNDTEQLILKLISYIFLVIVPSKTTTKFSKDENLAILNNCVVMYQFLTDSKMVAPIANDIRKMFKSTGMFSCFGAGNDVLAANMPGLKGELQTSINYAREAQKLKNENESIRKKFQEENESLQKEHDLLQRELSNVKLLAQQYFCRSSAKVLPSTIELLNNTLQESDL